MNKKSKRKVRIILATIFTAFFGSIAWTNEAIDYANKIGIKDLNPGYTFLVTAFLAVASFAWLIWEFAD